VTDQNENPQQTDTRTAGWPRLRRALAILGYSAPAGSTHYRALLTPR
jgi:hypothetical protein